MFPTGISVYLIYSAGFALVGLISFYLIAKIIDVMKIKPPWKSLVLFPFVVALFLYLMLLISTMLYGSFHDLKPHFLVGMIGFPTGWFVGLIGYYTIRKIKEPS